jgi:hypothetical protein
MGIEISTDANWNEMGMCLWKSTKRPEQVQIVASKQDTCQDAFRNVGTKLGEQFSQGEEVDVERPQAVRFT